MGKILSLNFRRILSDNIKTNVKCIFPLLKNIACQNFCAPKQVFKIKKYRK